ncbi:unnamed protein product [Arctia plantaginis]|uniref:Uncharacterized protein n=1 Tax=Arctia plantaginis TaxID=874455 RepID=A0A8S1AQY4_ARCPL|nr:unnamed protein product [Arctia plantaginis]
MYITISQQKSSEDVNCVLDKLIQQANDSEPNYNDENPYPLESYYPVSIDTENEPGNDSNIYYFKTYMAPQIEFKNDPQRSDKPVQIANNLQSRKSDEADKKMKLLANLITKHKVNDLSSKRSPYGRFLPKSLKMLHKYPEIIVNELGNNNYSDALTLSDTEFKNKTSLQDLFLKKTSSTVNSVAVLNSSVKPTLKNEFQKPDAKETKISPQEKSVPESNEELKKLIHLITQNKEVNNSLLKEIRERDSREQNILLEKKRLSEYKPKEDEPNYESRAAAPYPLAIQLSSIIDGLGLPQNSQRNVVSTTYLHTPVATYHLSPRVPTKPYLPPGVLSFSRNNALQQARLRNALVNRGISRYSFGRNLPVRYG